MMLNTAQEYAPLRLVPSPERPRERLQREGPRALRDEELVALLLRTGSRGRGVMDVARELVQEGLGRLARYSLEELCSVGLGLARASAVMAAMELGRRLQAGVGPPVATPEEAYALLRDMGELRKEHFRALYLDARRRLLRQETVSIGTLTASLVHPREVFQPALECSAAALLVAHNHPSGDPDPSPEDQALTRRLRQAGELLGIELVDHLIIGRTGFVSLKARGDL